MTTPSSPHPDQFSRAQQAPSGPAPGAMPSYQPVQGQYGRTGRGAPPPQHARLLKLTLASAGLYLLNLLVTLVVTSTVDLTAAYERLGFTAEQAQLAATQATGSTVSTIITAVIALGLYALVYSGLKKGRNWARILGIILAILSAVGTVFGVFGSLLFGGWAVVLIALTVAVLIVDILWLITAFKAPVRAWFTLR
jgi:hypothetical protein